MANWLIYMKERFPLAVYTLLVGGMSLSGNYLASDTLDWKGVLMSYLGIMWFFGLLRLMDELKDFDKDVIAHPERPLPRGILTRGQVRTAIYRGIIGMGLFSVVIGAVTDPVAGFLHLFITIYLWLMYKDFYLGDRLSKSPIFYAITHQLSLVPICLLMVATVRPELAFSFLSLRFAFAVFGSFFAYEVCRKLDPKAHELLGTYLAGYGPGGVVLMVATLTAIAARAADRLNLEIWLWPLEGALLLSLTILFIKPDKYKVIEGIATLSLLFHIWAITFQHWLRVWGVM